MRKEHKSKKGGLTAAGRAYFKRKTGANLKPPVTESNPKGKKLARKKSFCARMSGVKGPMKDKKGRPTNAFSFLLIAQIARTCIKNTDISPSQSNQSFLELVKIAGDAIGVNDLVDLVDESLNQINK